MNADEIRNELQRLAQVRAGLEADLERVRTDVAQTLEAADECPEISIAEAARLVGLSRFSVYQALGKSR